MKKRISAVLLAVFLLGLVGCTPAGPGPWHDPEPPLSGEETDPEEGRDPEGEREPEGGGESVPEKELPDADLLAFSLDRLGNADFSFRFPVGETAAVRTFAVAGDKGEWEPHVPVAGETHSGRPEDLLAPTEDFFDSNASVLDLARDRAETIREEVLQSITVMNTAVHAGLYDYVLDYDAQTDTLHVIRAQKPVEDPFTVTESYDILIYPDEDGDETVEYWCVATQTGRYDRATHLIYIPEKRYYIEATDVFPSTETESGIAYQSNIREMYRKGDDWFGYSLMFRTDTPFFDRRGTYEMADFFSLEFVTKTADGIVRSATGSIRAYDGVTGERKAPQESYAATDEFRFEIGDASFGEIYMPNGTNVSAPGSAVTGWDEVRLAYVSDGGGGLREEYTVDFTNGVSLGPTDFYKKGYGILRDCTETTDGRYVCEDAAGEKVYFPDWAEMCADRVILTTHAVYIEDDPIHQVSFEFAPDPDSDDPLGLVEEFWEALGISVREGSGAPSDLFGAFAQADAQAIAEEIMLDVRDGALGLDGVGQICKQATDVCDGTIARLKTVLNGLESVEWEDMPARPDDFGLIRLGGGLKGEATVSEAGVDYSALTFDAARTVIFTKGAQYALYVAWGSLVQAVTEPFSYAGEAFTLTGIEVSLPDLPVGTYTAKLFLGRALEEGCARISDALPVPVAAFGTVTVDGGEERGLRKMTDFTGEEELRAEVTLVDLEAPKLFVNGAPAEEPYELIFAAEEGRTVSDLFELLTVTDNSVGIMSARAGAFACDGAAVFAGDALVSGTYIYTIRDGGGNSASVTFLVTVNEPEEPAPGEPDEPGE